MKENVSCTKVGRGRRDVNTGAWVFYKKAVPSGRPFTVISPRFERGTDSLEGCCSIQLSYETETAQI